ncbi:MAG: hypothetical protein AVDCRST_MAG76-3324 [uncultured Acidimicrobiales bacterium]|uniref:Uncharacterized protein n=1 Tax=uncultured Acidimicrobiales bacterium TaxID=310071 RepID=A0A6J4J7S1_9ACTN|nr:MAG: hypothetical protein AVDCRST_MAG76-3324 [uncultured Acidimicrobiales bacterium]
MSVARPVCRRCGRPVVLESIRYDVFEGMHYVLPLRVHPPAPLSSIA